MTDERVDALIRRLDLPSSPDPSFVRSTGAMLLSQARKARVQDASRLGRLFRDVRVAIALAARPSAPQPIALAGLICLLLLALAAAIVVVGALTTTLPSRNGPLIVSVGGEIRAIDVSDGTVRPIGAPDEKRLHVSRSPDGRNVAYWRADPTGDQLILIGIDGQGRRRLADEEVVTWSGCTDTWSSDSRYLASEVRIDRSSRILVADTVTGIGRLVTPEGVVANCPLWSPDGRWLAFTTETSASSRVLAVIRTDGTGMRAVSGDLGGARVSGPNTWSPDGNWIYFDANRSGAGRIYRVNVAEGVSTQLSDPTLSAFAPTSSPDGTRIAFIVDQRDRWDLYIAASDGSDAHRLLEHAENFGWSADGRYVLTRWTPRDQRGGVAVISADGTEFRVVVPFEEGCPADTTRDCLRSLVGWGQPRP